MIIISFSYDPLWKLLVDRNMTKTDLKKLIKTSSATITKMGKNQYVSMKILDNICTALNCKIENVIEHKNFILQMFKNDHISIISSAIHQYNVTEDNNESFKINLIKEFELAIRKNYANKIQKPEKNVLKNLLKECEVKKILPNTIIKEFTIMLNNNSKI